MSGMVGEEALKLVQAVVKAMKNGNRFDKSILEKIVINSAGQGNIQAEFKVSEEMTNRGGTLHGGCTATIVDVVSTLGLMTSRSNVPGVSVNLNVNYLKGAAEGEEIVVDSKTLRTRKTLAYLDIHLKKKSSGEIIATGSHVKYVGG